MDTVNFKDLTLEEFAQCMLQMTPEQIHSHVKQLTPIQIGLLIQNLNHSEKEKKLIGIITAITDPEALKIVGQHLQSSQALGILGNVTPEKILIILTGMSYPIFKETLEHASSSQLQEMAEHSEEEPVQHYLVITSHEINFKINEFDLIIASLEQQINHIDISQLESADLIDIETKIADLASDCENYLKLTQKALILAWNSNRLDLIDNLSHAKETLQRYHDKGIYGTTGLYQHLQNHLASVFGSNPWDVETLKDEEPAIEGLAKLSVWFLQDYWEIGLLPEIKDISFLELTSQHSEKERTQYRIDLFKKVQKRLDSLGLSTVKNLKDAGIYSKEELRRFINHL